MASVSTLYLSSHAALQVPRDIFTSFTPSLLHPAYASTWDLKPQRNSLPFTSRNILWYQEPAFPHASDFALLILFFFLDWKQKCYYFWKSPFVWNSHMTQTSKNANSNKILKMLTLISHICTGKIIVNKHGERQLYFSKPQKREYLNCLDRKYYSKFDQRRKNIWEYD